ncbi:ABC transporter ATP-binding protein [Deinococcus radiodurans]|jgi:ABC-type multidrug transport system, ATPase and permease components|nr:ABC transporter ATP-binding protein [Deinococcus radiodurans]ANC70552.1 ABC transporter ATP-binding protein [Deinococcus radiodurans R1 = ATCC 13939 = DSM 20539]QIP28066.1 ABC transporter ATP-binding protein [Deinococcus radiodurans]QIP31053.1 ABC transporter ATP-binding protein [Deinococcus radiodurans]UID71364.1 ABC transporter ATP-binding protein [Deinococcus radiodurans R1 = ATCC 13939 = DSM 20539]UTA51708.1 ABC transporter ATP-binding protein/permease [Deinococcus radiodurans]
MLRPLPQKEDLSNRELLAVLARTLPDLIHSAPRLVLLMLGMAVVQGLMPALTILLGKWTVDGVGAALAGREANLTLLAAAWAGTALLTQVTGVGAQVLQGYAADHFTVQTMGRLMNKMGELPGLDVLEDPRFHDDIEILQMGAPRRPLNLVSTLLYLIRSVISAVSVSATLLSIGWWVPLVVVAGMLPALLKQMEFYKLGWSIFIQRTQDSREVNYLQRVAMRHEYAKEVRLYGLLPYLQSQYLSRTLTYQQTMRGVRNKQLLGILPYQALSLLVTAGLFVYVVNRAQHGTYTAGSVVLVITALAGLRDELRSISEYLSTGTEHLNWFAKFHRFLDATPGVTLAPDPRPLPRELSLTLQDVSFGYRGQSPVIEHLSLTIPEGQTVAIVGENGAGKTTLVKLLLRFYDPSEGRILIGGAGEQTDLRDLDVNAWRRQVAAVFQDFARFEWTLRDNVTLGQPEDAAKLSHAVEASGLGAALNHVDGGLDARIGQAFGGVDLSGGQWQKLATARALYREARVLILDEPTAALDPRSEKEVFDAFAALSQGRTTLLITHRLGSVLMADRVLVMKRGRLIEDGTHTELLTRGGEYAELWELQASQYAESPVSA